MCMYRCICFKYSYELILSSVSNMNCVAVDGEYCMSCGSDKSVKLWNPHKGTLLHTYAGHGYEVLDARGSSDNS